jgi:hypothetical protein
VKYLADDMFLAGVNRIFYHGTCYSPDDAPWPGWLFYASTEMNPRNPIWHDVPALNEYIARVQSVLQSGKPDNDILLYWPVADFWSNPAARVQPMGVSTGGWFEGQNIAKTAHELWNRGYAFDYVSDAQLLQAKVVDGKIQMPGGDYKVIVVPECKFMPLETFKQLLALAENGATIIVKVKLPDDIAGFDDYENRHVEFQKLVATLKFLPWIRLDIQTPLTSVAFRETVGKGTLLMSDEPSELLELAQVSREAASDLGLRFVRRSFDGGWNYFIANRSGTNFDGWITLGRDAKSTVILDPMTGNSGVAAQNATGMIHIQLGQIHLQLAAGESVILRAFGLVLPEDHLLARWNYWQTNGEPVEISGNWNVKFISGGPALPADSQITKLASWTTFADTNTQAFAGTASYTTTFDAPDSSAGKNYFLDLGDVRQSARVKLNGKDYGTLITPPFRVLVDNLQPTGNTLEVEVTSVAANRIRDLDRRGVKWKIFKDINIVNVDYKPFDASNWPLTDCGLLGPVTLTALAQDKN